MPQLRERSSEGVHDSSGASQFDGFDRIFGLETEYGVSLTGSHSPLPAAEVAAAMFEPVVSRWRSTNVFLPNGGRLYLDVGSHPEYATAEARDPLDALVQDLAGERIMAQLAHDAQQRLRATHGDDATLHVFKNNVDSAGHAFGCHENYLIRRFVPLTMIRDQLLPFLVTRQLFTGAGRVVPGGDFQITQRADFLDDEVSSATTRSRPMVNTRDEPHADSSLYRRLHVIIGDSNRSQWATWCKLATTHLVLCVIEHAARHQSLSGFEPYALRDPNDANRALSRDITGSQALLQLRGQHTDGDNALTALDMQYRYHAIVHAFVEEYRGEVERSLPRTAVDEVLASWLDALDTIRDGEPSALLDRVDWVAKHRLVSALRTRNPTVSDAQIRRLALDYHDVAAGTAYEGLLNRSVMRRLVDEPEVTRALTQPPSDTRAQLRGEFIAKARAADVTFLCDWTHLAVAAPERAEATLLDPFCHQATADYDRLIRHLSETTLCGPIRHPARSREHPPQLG